MAITYPTTVITDVGLAAAAQAGLYGPKVNVRGFKIGNNIITPLSTMSDVSGFVYGETPTSTRLTYQIINDATVAFKVSLDESIGNFDIGNLGLFLDTGELFTITAMPQVTNKVKNELPIVVGNRRIFTIPIVLSGVAEILDLTLIVQDEANVPTVDTENDLPDAAVAPFSVYSVLFNSLYGKPTLALRVDTLWYFIPSDLPIGGGGIQFIAPNFEEIIDPPGVGDVVYIDPADQLLKKADGLIYTKPPIGIRGAGNNVIKDGIYEDPAYTLTPGATYYADGGLNVGLLTTVENSWIIGVALSATKIFVGVRHYQYAQETLRGMVELATTQEVRDGVDPLKAITPFSLAQSGVAVNENELSNGQFFRYDTSPGFVLADWTFTSAGTSVLDRSLVTHNTFDLIEGEREFLQLFHSSVDLFTSNESTMTQNVDNAAKWSDTQKTVSFRAKSDVALFVMQVGLVINFGTGGDPFITLPAQTVNVINTWAEYSVTFDIPDLTFFTFGIGLDDYLQYQIRLFPSNSSQLHLDWIKAEKGATNTPIIDKTPEYTRQDSAQKIIKSWEFTQTIIGTALQALWADLGERYEVDIPSSVEPGDVVRIGGPKEIQKTTGERDYEVFGIISTQPAYMMNSKAGDDSTHPFVALVGKVPCKCVGTLRKGDWLAPSKEPGVARRALVKELIIPSLLIGRSLEDKTTEEIGKIMVAVK